MVGMAAVGFGRGMRVGSLECQPGFSALPSSGAGAATGASGAITGGLGVPAGTPVVDVGPVATRGGSSVGIGVATGALADVLVIPSKGLVRIEGMVGCGACSRIALSSLPRFSAKSPYA